MKLLFIIKNIEKILFFEENLEKNYLNAELHCYFESIKENIGNFLVAWEIINSWRLDSLVGRGEFPIDSVDLSELIYDFYREAEREYHQRL